MDVDLHLSIVPEPDDSTCGPACLHSIYEFFNDPIALESVIAEVPTLAAGGTLARDSRSEILELRIHPFLKFEYAVVRRITLYKGAF